MTQAGTNNAAETVSAGPIAIDTEFATNSDPLNPRHHPVRPRLARQRRPWLAGFAAALTATLVLTGCGGKSDKKDSAKKDDLDESVAMKGDPDSNFCQSLRRIDEINRSLSPGTLEESYNSMVEAAQELPKQAPKDMAEPVKVYVDAMEKVVDHLRSNNFDINDLDITNIDGLDLKSFEDASTRVMKYQVDVCGIDNGAGSADTTPNDAGAGADGDVPASSTDESTEANNGD